MASKPTGPRIGLHTGTDLETDKQVVIPAVNVDNQNVALAHNPHSTLNFTGSGVTATDVGGGVARINIPGGTTPGIDIENQGTLIAGNPHATLNFVGAGVVASDAAGIAVITIPGAPVDVDAFIFDSSATGGVLQNNGTGNSASGANALSEGNGTSASGAASHAEGNGTQAFGDNSHCEGFGSVAFGLQGHAEGSGTAASALNGHAEGNASAVLALSTNSHAEGDRTSVVNGNAGHAEGILTSVSNDGGHAEGNQTTSTGPSAHAEGDNTTASGTGSHAEGHLCTSNSNYSHAEGNTSVSNGLYSHAEGDQCHSDGEASHAQGSCSLSLRKTQHAHASGMFATQGDAQQSFLVLRGTTPGAAINESVELLFGVLEDQRFQLEDGKAYNLILEATAGGVQAGPARVTQAFVARYVVQRNAGVTTIDDSGASDHYGSAAAADWTLTATVGAAPDRVRFTFQTGAIRSACAVALKLAFTEVLF